MPKEKLLLIRDVELPWSKGILSAKMYQAGKRIVVGVPQLGLSCYGNSESETAFRLFTTLLKYYRQLNENPEKLTLKGQADLTLLRSWVEGIQDRLMAPTGLGQVVSIKGK